MKYITIISLLGLLSSCGNPHISSVTEDQPIQSPLTKNECEDALNEVRIHTESDEFDAVAGCQEQQDQQQQQEQNQQQQMDHITFSKALSSFSMKIPELEESVVIEVSDCGGYVIAEKEVSAGTDFLGVTSFEHNICGMNIKR